MKLVSMIRTKKISIFVMSTILLSNLLVANDAEQNKIEDEVKSTRDRTIYLGSPSNKSITPKSNDAPPRKSEFGNSLYVGKYATEKNKSDSDEKFKDPRGAAYSSDDLEPDDDL